MRRLSLQPCFGKGRELRLSLKKGVPDGSSPYTSNRLNPYIIAADSNISSPLDSR